MTTMIHFHELTMETSGNQIRQVKNHRVLSYDERISQPEAITLLKESGIEPADDRVMLEYVE